MKQLLKKNATIRKQHTMNLFEKILQLDEFKALKGIQSKPCYISSCMVEQIEA